MRSAAAVLSKVGGNLSANGVGAMASTIWLIIHQTSALERLQRLRPCRTLLMGTRRLFTTKEVKGQLTEPCAVRSRQQNHRSKCLELPVEIQLFRLNLFLNYKLTI